MRGGLFKILAQRGMGLLERGYQRERLNRELNTTLIQRPLLLRR